MLRGRRLALAKGTLLALLRDAYQARADAALVCFGPGGVQLRRQPMRVAAWNEDWVLPIPGGGGSPLHEAVSLADSILADAARRHPERQCQLWVLTDGRGTTLPVRPGFADRIVVVDMEDGGLLLGRCRALAREWDAEYVPAAELVSGGGGSRAPR